MGRGALAGLLGPQWDINYVVMAKGGTDGWKVAAVASPYHSCLGHFTFGDLLHRLSPTLSVNLLFSLPPLVCWLEKEAFSPSLLFPHLSLTLNFSDPNYEWETFFIMARPCLK